MSESRKATLSGEEAERILGDLRGDLSKTLEDAIPSDLDGERREALEKRIRDSLKREITAQARRTARRFLDEDRKRLEREEKRTARLRVEADMVERFALHFRVQHMILFASTLLLIVTGLPIKFHEAEVSRWIIAVMGGPQFTSLLHRIGAVGLTFIGFYHLFYTLVFETGRRDFGLLLPKPGDVKDFFHQMGYFLGLKKTPALFGRFSYIEKFDYWAVYWGMVVMITSGYILWFKDEAINATGKYVYDIAREAHSDEALLATLAIVIWHFYNVHFNPKKFPGSLTWWHGKITLEEFREEHPLEYEEWAAGREAGEFEAGGGA